ncbi:MAG TPA: PASTA domain-containing protein [Candidatus Aquicultor sp.]|jgi:serine/threonine-protein kinase
MDDVIFGGRYRATEKIAVFDGKETYTGADESGAPIVLKTIVLMQTDVQDRLLRDAAVLAEISHANVGRVYGSGREGAECWVAREYVPGSDLKTVLVDDGRLGPVTAASYAARACDALSATHARDVVHGDIKPQNIIRTPQNHIKVVDFGFGAITYDTIASGGALPETADYISPEQAQGYLPSPASDVYSLGVVLYELTTGTVPFRGDTARDTAAMQVDTIPVRLRQINAGIPATLEAIILRAMAKQPTDRYRSAEEMRQDLDRFIEEQEIPSTPPRRPIWPWVIGAIALVLLIAGAAYAIIGRTGTIPNVIGETQTQAESTINNAGFSVGNISQLATTTVQPGIVLKQTPGGGTNARLGSAIDLTVSEGPQPVAVPDVTGQTETDAATSLQAAGFTVKTVQAFSDTVPTGSVISQSPIAGASANPGSMVTITVSEGPTPSSTTTSSTTSTTILQVTVPNVVGQSQAAATSTLQAAGFIVRVNQAFNDTVPAGGVITQAPTAGSLANSGSTATIVVSRGPAPTSTTSST